MKTSVHVRCTHQVFFTRDAFSPTNPVFARLFEPGAARGRMLVVADDQVLAAWPDLEKQLLEYLRAHPELPGVAGPIVPVPGGEVAKNQLSVLENILSAIHEARLCRHSYVIAVGGGAVLDAVGFAASISHRGVRLIRFPTTTLSQGDSGVGVKNGINAFGKKNYLGAFSVPHAVVNDFRFLETLSERDWKAGFSEAVKVALLKEPGFFQTIAEGAAAIAARKHGVALPVIRRSAELHLRHIVRGGDPFELTEARPLDFGHWAAHKLEQMTGFRLNHGEAVAIGLALDVEYSALIGLLPQADAQGIQSCLVVLGFSLSDSAMGDIPGLLEGLEEFREHLGGSLTVTLLRGIGQPVEVHEIDRERMAEAARRLLQFESAPRPLRGTDPASWLHSLERMPVGAEITSPLQPSPDSRPGLS